MSAARDTQIAFINGLNLQAEDCSLDLTGANDVEVLISADGTRVWVNTPQCRLRVCGIRGEVKVNDMRAVDDGK